MRLKAHRRQAASVFTFLTEIEFEIAVACAAGLAVQ